jgi:hypothetical protein
MASDDATSMRIGPVMSVMPSIRTVTGSEGGNGTRSTIVRKAQRSST